MSKIWSNPTWAFFHTFAEKVDIAFYNRNRDICLKIVKTICGLLPCPVCRVHATRYMKRINIQQLQTKEDFKHMLFRFHNTINIRLRKPAFQKKNLGMYKKLNMIYLLNLMCEKIKSFYKTTVFRMSITDPDFAMLNNIQTSIYKYQRFFL